MALCPDIEAGLWPQSLPDWSQPLDKDFLSKTETSDVPVGTAVLPTHQEVHRSEKKHRRRSGRPRFFAAFGIGFFAATIFLCFLRTSVVTILTVELKSDSPVKNVAKNIWLLERPASLAGNKRFGKAEESLKPLPKTHKHEAFILSRSLVPFHLPITIDMLPELHPPKFIKRQGPNISESDEDMWRANCVKNFCKEEPKDCQQKNLDNSERQKCNLCNLVHLNSTHISDKELLHQRADLEEYCSREANRFWVATIVLCVFICCVLAGTTLYCFGRTLLRKRKQKTLRLARAKAMGARSCRQPPRVEYTDGPALSITEIPKGTVYYPPTSPSPGVEWLDRLINTTWFRSSRRNNTSDASKSSSQVASRHTASPPKASCPFTGNDENDVYEHFNLQTIQSGIPPTADDGSRYPSPGGFAIATTSEMSPGAVATSSSSDDPEKHISTSSTAVETVPVINLTNELRANYRQHSQRVMSDGSNVTDDSMVSQRELLTADEVDGQPGPSKQGSAASRSSLMRKSPVGKKNSVSFSLPHS